VRPGAACEGRYLYVIRLFIWLSICVCICYVSIYLYVYMSTYLSIYLRRRNPTLCRAVRPGAACKGRYMHVNDRSIYRSICLYGCLSIYIYMHIYLASYLPTYRSIHLNTERRSNPTLCRAVRPGAACEGEYRYR